MLFQRRRHLACWRAQGICARVIAELIGEAMLGPATTECNWLVRIIDATRYRDQASLSVVAEEILTELRECPPAPGFDRVEIPGERERIQRETSNGRITLPQRTWEQIRALAASLSVD